MPIAGKHQPRGGRRGVGGGGRGSAPSGRPRVFFFFFFFQSVQTDTRGARNSTGKLLPVRAGWVLL